MKVQLVVVQGKPEGKVIPLLGPIFKIGRGETCHLRPNSELVSREHAEFTVTADSVVVKDLDSRNGTLVNGKALTEAYTLKDRDLVQVGNLTFAVSIQGAPVPVVKPPTVETTVPAAKAPTSPAPAPAKPAPAPAKQPSASGIGNDMVESWLVADSANPTPERPSGVYGGDTITITAFKNAFAAKPPAAPSAPAPAATPSEDSDEEYERLPEGEGDPEDELQASSGSGTDEVDQIPDEFIDESNPFHAKRQASNKPVYKDSSDAASDILKKMMERRRKST